VVERDRLAVEDRRIGCDTPPDVPDDIGVLVGDVGQPPREQGDVVAVLVRLDPFPVVLLLDGDDRGADPLRDLREPGDPLGEHRPDRPVQGDSDRRDPGKPLLQERPGHMADVGG